MKIKALIFTIGTLIACSSFAQSTTPASASAATSGKPAVPAKPMASTSTAVSASSSAMAEAAGGGADKVWVNTKSNTYHCFGTKFYGKTKMGGYMTEADAKTKGAHADHGKACGK